MLSGKCVMGGFCKGGQTGGVDSEKAAGADTCSLTSVAALPRDDNSRAPRAQGDSNCRLSQGCVSHNEDKQ